MHHPTTLRILNVIDTLEVGGAEQSLLETASRLDRERFCPDVCTLYPGNALQDAFQAAGIAVHSLGLGGKYQFGRGVLRLRRLVRQLQPDVIHTSLFRAGQVGRLAGWLGGVPVISTWNSVPYSRERIENDAGVSAGKLNVLRRMDALTARMVTRFHSVSACVREVNCRDLGVPAERVTVIPRGRELSRYGPPARDAAALVRRELGAEDAAPLLLHVGRLIPAKNHATLVRAMAGIWQACPRALLLLAGDGPLRGPVEQLVGELQLGPCVRLLGRRTDVPALLAAADVFVFPSVHEGQPGALIEAMLAGCPIVASDIPMNRDLIEHGRTGLLARPQDAADLAEGVLRLARDRELARRLGATAQDQARRRYDIRQVVSQMQALYEAVAVRRNWQASITRRFEK